MLAAFAACSAAEPTRPKFELRQPPTPSLKGLPPGSLLIKSRATSICGSDLFGSGGCCASPEWRKPIDYLKTPKAAAAGSSGHEVIGTVAAVVPGGESDVQVGDAVLALTAGYIASVTSCRTAFEQATQQWRFLYQ